MAEIFTLTILVIKWLIAIILGIFTLFIAYCIGTLLSANEKNIVTAKSAITPTKNNNISIIDISPAVFKV